MPDASATKEKDILKLLPAPAKPPKLTARRIGIHTSTAGGVANAAERAYRLGCNTFQIFSSSPRQWKPYELAPEQRDEMVRLRAKYDLRPLVIHANYLVNLAGGNPEFHAKSIAAFRAEIERALALQAEFLVLHPGSFRGGSREEGLQRAALGIEQAADGLDLQAGNLRILIENTAGSEFSLGGSFEQVAELLYLLRNFVPCGACIDTCHTHVAGYDIVSEDGYNDTLDQLDRTVGLQQRPRLALQRRQGRVRLDARPPPEHRQGNHRPRALPPPAQRPAPGQRGLHRRNPHRPSRSTTSTNVNALKNS